MFWRRSLLLFLGVVSLVAGSFAASPYKQPVTFTYTADAGFGNSVFVVGSHPDVGGWDVTKAVKLRYTAGNVWTGQIAVQAGTALQYRFLSRATAPDRWFDPANTVMLSGTLSQSVPAQPAAPYRGKTIYYLSGWPQANVLYRIGGADWSQTAMTRLGAGRTAGESLFKISGLGEAGENLEFVFNDGAGHWDNPPGGGNYFTACDVFQVQDGSVSSYTPPSAPSAPEIVTAFINSTAPGIPGRTIKVYLPRGYAQNTWKRYPVLYLHDGQKVFDPGGPFGSWSADATATREMSQGRVREAILVAIDNAGSARIAEYLPPTDSYQGTPGRADAYASFVINNVRPYVDTTFRTLNDPANTLTLGSSLGGLVSLYLGREFSTFGKVGVLSPAFWIAPNYRAQVAAEPKKALRVYLDMGTAEGASYWDDCLAMFDQHLAQGHAANGDLLFAAGNGQAHNESAWAARLPAVLGFLLPAGEEAQMLAGRDFPPRLAITAVDALTRRATFTYTGLFGFSYGLEHSVDGFGNWTSVSTTTQETLPWAIHELEDADPALTNASRAFWRLRYPAQP